MNMIDIDKIDGSFAYIKLPDDFSINDECQIIFAPNGTGKKTLFNILVKQNKDKCEIYTYDDAIEPTYKCIDGKKKKIEINPLSSEYSKEESNKKTEMIYLTVKDMINILFPNRTLRKLKKELKDGNEILNTINDDCVCSFYAPLSNEERNKLKYILDYFNDLKDIISKRTKLVELSKENKEANLNVLRLIDKQSLYVSYNIEDHKEEIEKDVCPICGRKDKDVYKDILKIKKEIQSAKIDIFENYEFLKHLPKDIKSLDAIEEIIDVICALSDEKLLFLLLSQGSKAKEESIKESQIRYKIAVSNIKKYVDKRDEGYKGMVLSKKTIETCFPKIFPNTSINFDDENKIIVINTHRNMETYSEGEKHEMYSTIRELAIIGSDKNYVIADEPLTDLDVANEYKNVFRFVNLANEHKKKIIIFTCNPNFINIANKYHCSLFKYYYLISNLKKDGYYNLKLLTMNLRNENKHYLSLKNVIGGNLIKKNTQVVRLIKERNELEITKNKNDRYKELSELLHYNSKVKIKVEDTYEISNDDLVSAIELFETLPEYSDFSELVRDRIFYLAALRVYIEKNLFDYNQDKLKHNLSSCFPKKNRIYSTKEKIIKVDEKNGTYNVSDKYKNWNRYTLMCLKTLLNDNDHPYSQIISFAISIGNNAFENEIKMVKKYLFVYNIYRL